MTEVGDPLQAIAVEHRTLEIRAPGGRPGIGVIPHRPGHPEHQQEAAA